VVGVSDDVWAAWREARPPSTLLHLDAAAVGRSSTATLEATAAHARLEAELGGYVAEDHVAPQLAHLRRDVAGLLGTDAEGVASVESATASLEALLRAWPHQAGHRVLVAPSEWGPNLELLDAHALVAEPLVVDAEGVVDLEALERRLASGPTDGVLVDHVAAHRGLVQPVAEILALAHGQGVPVWLDAAQSVGHVVVPPGADAVVGTSRKWLAGPRGVGMLAVAEQHRPHLRVRRPAKHPDLPAVHQLESDEAHVAGRVGLGVAVGEHLELGTEVIADRLAEVGRAVREMATSLVGWEVVHPHAPAGAITALRPTAGQDVGTTRDRMLHEHDVLTSVCQPWRAPGEAMGGPWLRLSPHVDLTDEDLARTASVLSAM
jgi:pyridoxal 5-phosphate dependent beta-lyase